MNTVLLEDDIAHIFVAGDMSDKKIRVLFLCTGNSCRSQMAEGWCKHLKSDTIKSYSAGTTTHGLNARAVRVMGEVGVDISHHRSKTVDEFPDKSFDMVFTVCDKANNSCPRFVGENGSVVVHHVPFGDPPQITQHMLDEEHILNEYRKIRDEIKNFIDSIEKYDQE